MLIKRKRIMIKFLTIWFVSIIILNQYLVFSIIANSYYNNALELGTQIYEVEKYNKEEWKNSVSITLNPNDWFDGDADRVNAKSKITILSKSFKDITTYIMFLKFIVPQEKLQLFLNLSNYGYNYTYIMNNYRSYYKVWEYEYLYWPFTVKEFNDTTEFPSEYSYIIQDPQDFKSVLKEYNNFSTIINNDPLLQSLNLSLPILNGDNLLWQLILAKIAIASPINTYLTTIVDKLECKNVTVLDSNLILQRYGEMNYSVEIGYNPQGIIETFIIKNSENIIIYKIISFYPKIIFFIIVGIIAIFILGLTILVILKKRKRMKLTLKKDRKINLFSSVT